MKKSISYNVYLDKVYGAWLGKCIAGNIGAPFEGRKELFNYTYDPVAIEKMFPNDDLDLQIIWLDVLEKKGIHISSMDLAEAFYNLYPYCPGEYAYFKKNYSRGLYPPVSGAFNNRYYINGMGCPIRAEIWALICPGNAELAASYAAKDGVLDHEGDSVYAEQFLAAMEAEAFFEGNLHKLIEAGRAYLPEGSKILNLVDDVVKWCSIEEDWRKVRLNIIAEYGHPDCTNLYQNIGFTLLALLHGKGNLLDMVMIALNCGFDTDCSCGIAGALQGLIEGASSLIERYGFYDTGFKLDALVTRRSDKLEDLAVDTCRVGLAVASEINKIIDIQNAPEFDPLPAAMQKERVEISIDYHGNPVIGYQETKSLRFKLQNKSGVQLADWFNLKLPEGWTSDYKPQYITLQPDGEWVQEVKITVPAVIEILRDCNTIYSSFGTTECKFGLNGAQVWRVYGPFWENHITLPHTDLGQWYYDLIKADTLNETADITRQYHLNTKACMDIKYINEPEGGSAEQSPATKALDIGRAGTTLQKMKNIYEDLFTVNDLIGYQGPCVVYMERALYSPADYNATLLVGHTDAYCLWLNGVKISESDQVDWWTAENKHHYEIPLKKGRNHIFVKLQRRSGDAKFSFIFTEEGKNFSKHLVALGSYTK